MAEVKTGVDLIAAERKRIDDVSDDCSMIAACYAVPERLRPAVLRINLVLQALTTKEKLLWQPTPDDRARELVKAGAMIAAEIDRLQAVKNDG